MGIITKEVKIVLTNNMIKYYEDLGYEIPRRKKNGRMSVPIGTTIVVKVEDLPNCSNVILDIEYDCCHKPTKMDYYHYVKYNHDGKIYCQHCNSGILNSKENHPQYKKEKTDEDRLNGRRYKEYLEFVKKVLERDKYTCQCCNKKLSGNAEVHHLDGYNWCIEKRTDETNGITLCGDCHSNFHLNYGRGYNTKEQFEEWLGETIELLKYNKPLPTSRQVYCIEDEVVYYSTQICADKIFSHEAIVRRVCDGNGYTINNKHYVWYDIFQKMSETEIKELLLKQKNCIPIICVTTGKFFHSIHNAEEYYHIKNLRVGLNRKSRYSGKLPDGTLLQWMYYEDFLKLPIEEQNEILARNKDLSQDRSFLV